MAADHRICRRRGGNGGAQDTRLKFGNAVVTRRDLDPAGAERRLVEMLGEFAQHPLAEFLLARLCDPFRNPRLAVIAGGNDDGKIRGLRDRKIEIGAAADAAGGALDQRGDAERLDLLDFRRHQPDNIRRLALRITWLIRRPEIDEDVFMRQDHAEFFARQRTQRCVKMRHGANLAAAAGPA